MLSSGFYASAALALVAFMPAVAAAQVGPVECGGERYLGTQQLKLVEADGWWLPRGLFECMVHQGAELREQEARFELRLRTARQREIAARASDQLSRAAEARTGEALLLIGRRAEELNREIGAWYRSPWLWAAIGAVGTLFLTGLSVWIVGSLG